MVNVPPIGGAPSDGDGADRYLRCKSRDDYCISSDKIVFAFSGTGSRHISAGTPCQDASMAVVSADRYVFICAADGHGGDDYVRSDEGSRVCCRAAYECMTDDTLLDALGAAADSRQAEKLITQLKKSVICRWNELIAEHFSVCPLREEELARASERAAERYRAGEYIERAYGTTMLAAVMTDDFCLVLQLGDGMCVVLRDGDYISPMPDDERCIGNQTTSMCDSRAFAETRHCFFGRLSDVGAGTGAVETAPVFGQEDDAGDAPDTETEAGRYFGYMPQALFLCTDGISNSFSDGEGLYNFYYMVTENLCETFSQKAAEKNVLPDSIDMRAEMDELREFVSIISQKGSGDDVSLASVIKVR